MAADAAYYRRWRANKRRKQARESMQALKRELKDRARAAMTEYRKAVKPV